ncbi:MAG: hypothetical protein IBX55_19450 [Methyloprofundus sp.]|nr:hypothetical protein [Methyloprofundus sp.]
MDEFFSIKYLEIDWYDRITITKITESLNELCVDYNSIDKVYEAETTIYPKAEGVKNGHLALRLLDDRAITPCIKNASGKLIPLKKIKDIDNNKYWWILADHWDENKKQWKGLAPNIAGTLTLVLGEHLCKISIGSMDFTRENLESYLRSFKNDLWELILDESSHVTAELKNSTHFGVNENIINCIKNLAISAEKIIKSPKVELRETQLIKPRKQVKPVNRTFMELATRESQRFLTSRATTPSFNVPENQYFLFVLERCFKIINQISIIAKSKARRYRDTVKKLTYQHDSLKPFIKINEKLAYEELTQIEKRAHIDYWKSEFNRKVKESGFVFSEHSFSANYSFKITGVTNKLDFFVEVKNPDTQVFEKPYEKTGILSLKNNFYFLHDVLIPTMIVTLNCNISGRNLKNAFIFDLNSIFSINLDSHPAVDRAKKAYIREKEIIETAKRNDWTKVLSNKELEEQEKERIALTRRRCFYEKKIEDSEYVFKKTAPRKKQIYKTIKDLRALGVKPSSNFPNSMTFVQNPNYQSIHNSYKLLRETTNLADEELLLSLEEIEEIGLINMPILYERWVLLQIIKVLIESYRFRPWNDWKNHLIDAINKNKKNIKITLTNISARRRIDLTYEYVLENGKRPDFVIDSRFKYPDPSFDNMEKKRFVMDAKFYDQETFNRCGGMMGVINNLYDNKNYSENNKNPVFVIHPCASLIKNQVTVQNWGKVSFLGEKDIDEDGAFYLHQKGAIFLNPVDRDHYNDELQRLLGMLIQYKNEEPETNQKSDLSIAKPICMNCGSSSFKRDPGRNNKSVYLTCNECGQMQVHNHCGTCHDIRLIKNGFHWSYHSAQAVKPFNMKCPKCGSFGAW